MASIMAMVCTNMPTVVITLDSGEITSETDMALRFGQEKEVTTENIVTT